MPQAQDGLDILTDVEEPSVFPGLNRHLLVFGAPVDPLDRLAMFTDEQFEVFVAQWARHYLHSLYHSVERRGGSGDLGRDIVAWIDGPGVAPRRWDLYQCKHHHDALTPSGIWVELGKLCYHTFSKRYTIPRCYYLASPKGVGNSLQDLINEPSRLRQELMKNWPKHCERAISSTVAVPLEGELLGFVGAFNFAIVKELPPADLLAQHQTTPYYAQIFGMGLKPRPTPESPPSEIADRETRYVHQMYEAFADHRRLPQVDASTLDGRTDLKRCFDHARECFYRTESFKEFTRDNWPDDRCFHDLLDQVYHGIYPTTLAPHPDGYQRMIAATSQAARVQPGANAFASELTIPDKIGMCHHLANDDRIWWVQR